MNHTLYDYWNSISAEINTMHYISIKKEVLFFTCDTDASEILLLIPHLHSFFRNFTFTEVFHDFPNRMITIPYIMLRFSY